MFRAWCWFIWIATAVSVLMHGPLIGELLMMLLANSFLYILPVWLLRWVYRRWQRQPVTAKEES